jgi:hypothetical protein
MVRSVAKKVMWVGRTTATLIGLAVALALVLGVAAMALAAVPGDPFRLGQTNGIDAMSALVGNVAGPMLMADNNSTGAGATALDLRVEAGKPPMKVNSTTKVTKLNADRLDGLDSTGLRVSCPEGTRLLGGACIENTARGAGDLPTSSSTCAGLGGRLPTAAELDAFRQFSDITIGNVGGLTFTGAEWTGDIVTTGVSTVDGYGADAMTDSGVYYAADKRNTQAFRCVVAPSG